MAFHGTGIAPGLEVHSANFDLHTHQFEQFFPAWNEYIQGILTNKCAHDYAIYRTENISAIHGVHSGSSLINPVLECILGQFPEYRKAEIAASGVVLGLIPTILQMLGSSVGDIASIGIRRPLLAILLSATSPAGSIIKSNSFIKAADRLVHGPETFREHVELDLVATQLSAVSSRFPLLVGLLEYVAVLGAVANVVYLTYQLGAHAIVVFAPQTVFIVPLWVSLGVVIHLVGRLGLFLCVKRVSNGNIDPELRERNCISRFWDSFKCYLWEEFTPLAYHPAKRFERRVDSAWFHGVSWFMVLGVLAHIVFGTLALSSLLFFSVVDAINVVFRFTLSAWICRIVVHFELSGLAHEAVNEEYYRGDGTTELGISKRVT